MNQQSIHFSNDEKFLKNFPEHIRNQNKNHYTPIEVAKVAAHFLSMDGNSKIIDLGSGIGKFCLTGAFFNPNCTFYGIEQRFELVELAQKAQSTFNISNVHFIHGNIDHEQLKKYDHIYFFNSFHEQLEEADKLDSNISHTESLYYYYNSYLYRQLESMPAGTRLATFFTLPHEIPDSYMELKDAFGGNLKLMMKI